MSDPILYGPGRGRGPLPLLVGILADRELSPGACAELHRRCARLLAWLGHHYRSTPIVVLAGVERSAGRCLARAALEAGPWCRLLILREPASKAADPAPESAALRAAEDERLASPDVATVIARHSQVLVCLGPVPVPERGDLRGTVECAIGPEGRLSWEQRAFAEASVQWRRLDAYNRDVVQTVREEAHHGSEEGLLPTARLRELPQPLQATIGALRAWYAGADALALAYQARQRRAMLGLFVVSFLAGYFLKIVYSLPGEGWAKVGYSVLACLASALGCWFWWRGYGRKHVLARALAEGLRVQTFWRLAGLREATPDGYLRWVRSDLGWVPRALRSWLLLAERGSAGADPALATSCWVEGQCTYFAAALPRLQRTMRRVRGGRTLALTLGVLWAVAHFLAGLTAWFPDPKKWLVETYQLGPRLTHALELIDVFLAMGLFILAGLLYTFGRTWILSRQAGRYQAALDEFTRARRQLEQVAGSPDKVCAELRDLGIRALEENGFWVELHLSDETAGRAT
jgi:hypothetical protein